MCAARRAPGTVAWVELSTPDIDTAGGFYADLLGWTLSAMETPTGRYVICCVAGELAAGMMAPEPGHGEQPPSWNVFFSVTDVDTAFGRAKELGARAVQPPMELSDGDRIAVVADPAGAVVGFMECHGEEGMAWNKTGAAAWVETQTRDLLASQRFYGELMSWSEGAETDGYHVFEHNGEQVAGLMAMPAEVPPEVPSYWMVYFAVDDVDLTCTKASDLGGTALYGPATVQDIRFAVFEDPNGAFFAVVNMSS